MRSGTAIRSQFTGATAIEGFMDGTNLAASSGLHEFVRDAVTRYGA
jgi:hypothetical protein